MATLATTTPAVKSDPSGATTLIIQGVAYQASPLDRPEPTVRLIKQTDGRVYDVCLQSDGRVACGCPNYLHDHAGSSSQCKHGRAVVAAGMLGEATAADKPVSRPGIDRVRDEFDEPTRKFHPGTGKLLRAVPASHGGGWADKLPVPGEPWAPDVLVPPPCCSPNESEPCKACVTIEPSVAIDPAAWEGEGRGEAGPDAPGIDPDDVWDDDEWETIEEDDDPDAFPAWRPDPIDDGERLTLVEYLEAVRDHFAAIGSGAADLIAHELGHLVNEAVILGRPDTAERFWDRRAAYQTV